MADDPNPALSAELEAARARLGPQIRGLNDLAATSVSHDLRDEIQLVQRQRMHRDDLLRAALEARDAYIAALVALTRDGYPALPNVQVSKELLAEIREEDADIEAAVGVFVPEGASSIAIVLGDPVAKTA